jgi:hypothetical protein
MGSHVHRLVRDLSAQTREASMLQALLDDTDIDIRHGPRLERGTGLQ